MGICQLLRCNGLEILVPKHPWKSTIGPLQLILATKRYISFFLGHPVVCVLYVCAYQYCRFVYIMQSKMDCTPMWTSAQIETSWWVVCTYQSCIAHLCVSRNVSTSIWIAPKSGSQIATGCARVSCSVCTTHCVVYNILKCHMDCRPKWSPDCNQLCKSPFAAHGMLQIFHCTEVAPNASVLHWCTACTLHTAHFTLHTAHYNCTKRNSAVFKCRFRGQNWTKLYYTEMLLQYMLHCDGLCTLLTAHNTSYTLHAAHCMTLQHSKERCTAQTPSQICSPAKCT